MYASRADGSFTLNFSSRPTEEAVIFMLIATHVSANSQVRAATARRAPHVRCLLSLFSHRKRSHSSPLRLLDVVVVSFALGSLTIVTWHREE